MLARANHSVFYIETAPPDARGLNERKQWFIKNIEFLKKYNEPEYLHENEAELAKIEEQLKPQKKMLQYGNQQQRAQFNEKIARYTNEELGILIGIMFDGKVPEPSHPAYSLYEINRCLLDTVLKDWRKLSAGDKGQIFLSDKEEWQRILVQNRFGFVETLRRRMLPEKNKERLVEPAYEMAAYNKKKEKRRVPVGTGQVSGAVISELTRKLKKTNKNQ